MEQNTTASGNIFKDFRGEIHFFNAQSIKLHVTFTDAGMLRGGDFHPNVQRDLVLKGTMEVTTHQNKKDVVTIYGPNELIEIPSNVPHLYKSITDTIMLEWREGEFKAHYYAPYRELVEQQLKTSGS